MSASIKRPLQIAVALLVVLGGALWLFWPKSLPPPDESRRVTHPAGYSIIYPPEFRVGINLGSGGVHADAIYIDDPNHKFPQPKLTVERFSGTPDFEKLKKRGFTTKGAYQGREALIMTGPSGRPPTQVWNHRAVVKFGDDFFEIGVSDPRYFDMTSSDWRPYFESFRYEPAPSTQNS